MNSITQQLWNDFLEHRNKTNHIQQLRKSGRPVAYYLKQTDQRVDALKRLRDWCFERELDPRAFLRSMFQTRRWLFAPKWEHFTEKSFQKHLPKFEKYDHKHYYAERLSEITHQSVESVYDPNRDLNNGVESLKRRLVAANSADICMDRMHETLGYHPKSLVCAHCPLSTSCSDAIQRSVNFDILALRRGEITQKQAQFQAAGIGNGT